MTRYINVEEVVSYLYMVLPTRFQLVCLMAMNFKFIVYGSSTTVADECLIILTGFWVVHCFSNILIR